MTQHSPTPWSIDHDDPTLIHENSDGRWRPVAEVFGNGLPNAQANAAFIVDSVNSHARLTEQRDELLAALKFLRREAGASGVIPQEACMVQADTAIAKCEVTQ